MLKKSTVLIIGILIVGVIGYFYLGQTMQQELIKLNPFKSNGVNAQSLIEKTDLGNLKIKYQGWNIDKTENGATAYIEDKNKKDTLLCEVYPNAKNKNDLPTRNVYTKKDKSIKKTYTEEKVNGQWAVCYKTTSEDYLQIGDNSTVFTYQEESKVVYEDEDTITSLILRKWNGSAYVNEPKDIWVKTQEECQTLNKSGMCFGAIDNSLSEGQMANYSYQIDSNREIVEITNYYFNYSYSYPIFYTYKSIGYLNEQRIEYNFMDICLKNFSDCRWEKKNNSWIVYFTSDKNIDPTITNVSGCATLSTANAYYQMNQSTSTSGNCFVINNHNITLDCNGYWINGTNTTNQKAVYNVGFNNITVMNCNIKNFGTSSEGGGCAFVYSYDGTKYTPEFAISDFAVHKEMEYTSYGLLNNINKINNQYHLSIYEQVPEIQYLDSIQLLNVIHPTNTWVIPEQNGVIHVFNKKIYPSEAIDDYGDSYKEEVSKVDDKFYIMNTSKMNFNNLPDQEGINFTFNNVSKGKVKVSIRAKQTGSLNYGFKLAVTLVEGKNKLEYNLLNNNEQYKLEMLNWALKTGSINIFNKELVNTMAFSNGEFYHTYSFTLDNQEDNLTLRIEGFPYSLQIDELYIDDTPEQDFTVSYLNVTEVGKTDLEGDIKTKLMSDDEIYLKIPLRSYVHLFFNDTNTKGTIIVKTKAYSESYSFKDGDKTEIINQDLEKAEELFTVEGKSKDYLKYFVQNYEIRNSLESLLDVPKQDISHSGIHFSNSTRNLIMNINITNTINIYEDGIYFNNVTNSQINNIRANNVSCSNNCGRSIYLYLSHYNQISNVTMSNSYRIETLQSNYNNISNCNITLPKDGGIYIASSNYTGIFNNTITNQSTLLGNAITLYFSNFATVKGNILYNNYMNFNVVGDYFNEFNHTVDTTNTINTNKKIFYNVSINNQIINNQEIGQVYCINCTNVTYRDLINLSYSYYGILLFNSTKCSVINSSFVYNVFGVGIDFSNNNSFFNNTIRGDRTTTNGFSITDSSNNTLNNNNMINLYTGDGFTLGISDYNSAKDNNITNCARGIVFNRGIGNNFNNTYISNCTDSNYGCLTFFSTGTSNNQIIGGTLNKNTAGYLIFAGGETNNTIQDFILINGTRGDVFVDAYANLSLINVTYNISKEYVNLNSSLYRYWYYQAYVNSTTGVPINGANITIFNKTNNNFLNLSTNSTGYTIRIPLIEYKSLGINSTGVPNRTYYNNYTFNATYGSNTTRHVYNLTVSNNIFDYFTFVTSCWTYSNKYLSIPPSCDYQDFGNIISQLI